MMKELTDDRFNVARKTIKMEHEKLKMVAMKKVAHVPAMKKVN